MEILLLRHGKTSGNLQRRYVGRTDEPLCPEGRAELEALFQEKFADPEDEVGAFLRMSYGKKGLSCFASPMCRCVQSFEILSRFLALEDAKLTTLPDLREMDFGKFEYNNYEELKDKVEYQKFIDTNGLSGFPEGEDLSAFKFRCIKSFQALIHRYIKQNIGQAIGVVHGGTIMALMEAFAPQRRDYFSWQVGNGQGYVLQIKKM